MEACDWEGAEVGLARDSKYGRTFRDCGTCIECGVRDSRVCMSFLGHGAGKGVEGCHSFKEDNGISTSTLYSVSTDPDLLEL
jgi:hypothetical protein